MAFCTTCGADAADKEFCSNCGSKVGAQAAAAPGVNAAPPVYTAPPAYTAPNDYGNVAGGTNVLAIVALVCGILGFFTGITSLGGIVCGHIALNQISRTREQGRGMAIAGLVTGYVVLAGGILFIIGAVIVGTAINGSFNDVSSSL